VRGGFSLLDMKRYAEGRGHRAQGFRSVSLDELAEMPHAVVPIDEHGDAHFVVVRGLRNGQVDLADPAFGNRLMSLERFGEIWKDGIAFVVTRRAP
jgi:predicted double-glycine peptidase